MDIKVFSSRELPTVFRVLRTALNSSEPLIACERSFLETFAKITGYPLTAADPLPIEARDVVIAGSRARLRLVQLAAVAALLSRPVRASSVSFVRTLAETLDTRDPVIRVLDAIIHKRFGRARLRVVRRLMRVMLLTGYRAEGWKGIVRFLVAMLLKLPVQRDRNLRYKRLGLLPEGTLGREFWKLMTLNGFGFPGEIGAIPDFIAYHDVGHVLAEHPASGLGEIQQASFQGGSRRDDGFAFVQLAILHFHQGIQISPATPAQVDNFDPKIVLWAIHRGAELRVDMTQQWDFWPLMPLPLDEARRQIGLLPKFSEPATAAL